MIGIILTTEKDGVRLVKFQTELKDLPVYVFPIRHKVLFGEEDKLNVIVANFIKNYPLQVLSR